MISILLHGIGYTKVITVSIVLMVFLHRMNIIECVHVFSLPSYFYYALPT